MKGKGITVMGFKVKTCGTCKAPAKRGAPRKKTYSKKPARKCKNPAKPLTKRACSKKVVKKGSLGKRKVY
jgi:hypothetical protein